MKKIIKIEWELWLAVHTLASMTENIRTRLATAYSYHLSVIHAEQMPTLKMQIKLREIQNRLTKNHTEPTERAIKKWRLKTCNTIADEICYIYYEYANYEWHLLPAEHQTDTSRVLYCDSACGEG